MSQLSTDSQASPSQDDQPSRGRQGRCQTCDRVCCLRRRDGNVYNHYHNGARCLGSGRPPRENTNQQPTLPVRQNTSQSFISTNNLLEAIKATSARTLQHIPKAARPHAAAKLSALLRKVNDSPGTTQAWHNLLLFGNICLATPARRDKTLAASVIKAINDFPREDNQVRLPTRARNTHGRKSNSGISETSKIRTSVTKKIEEGNTIGAIRVITSEDSIADRDAATAQALREKHPPRAPREDDIVQVGATGAEPLWVSESVVHKAALSFPTGSAGGFTGLKPNHIKQMLNPALGDIAQSLLVELTRFTNTCLAGNIPEAIRPIFFGASLCALKKKDGGIRPIAVGNSLRRLVAKAAARTVSEAAATMLKPKQLGFGIPQGCEAAAHAARAFIANITDEKALIKLDFKNAFNLVRRDAVLRAVHHHFPSLYPFVHSCYSMDLKLLFGEHEIDSQEGVQQGDPLAPLLFCLVIKQVTEVLSSELNIWFLDDGTLAGSQDSLLEDIRKIQDQGAVLGLTLNPSKCEIICSNQGIVERIESLLPNIHITKPEDSTLLGAPLGLKAIDDVLDKKIADLKRMDGRIEDIDAHDALYLITRCLSLPRLTYFLRCSPSYSSQKLGEYDRLLKSMLEKALNLSLDDLQWKQASLPVRLGGLGVRTATQIAVPAFLSSSSASDDLVKEILPAYLHQLAGVHDPNFTICATEWASRAGPSPQPLSPKAHKQSSWDGPIVDQVAAECLGAATTQHDIARLTAVAAPHAGDFLLTTPMSATGTRLTPHALRIAVALRLAAPIHTRYRCICGEVVVDRYGHHGLLCQSTGGWHSRHSEVNDIIKRSLTTAGCPAEREPRYLTPRNSDALIGRPDGITVNPWKNGKQLVWDYTCVSTLANTYIDLSVAQPGGAATHREAAKSRKYRELDHHYSFVPIASETLGAWGRSATSFLKELGSRLIETTRDPRAASFLFQRLSVAIQRGNAQCIQGSCPPSEELEELDNL